METTETVVHELSPAEADAELDARARRYLGISGDDSGAAGRPDCWTLQRPT